MSKRSLALRKDNAKVINPTKMLMIIRVFLLISLSSYISLLSFCLFNTKNSITIIDNKRLSVVNYAWKFFYRLKVRLTLVCHSKFQYLFILAGHTNSKFITKGRWCPMNSTGKANRLINETSPYLLQHAYNPVDWFPWSEEAFAKAKDEDKPVFLSIGYSWLT